MHSIAEIVASMPFPHAEDADGPDMVSVAECVAEALRRVEAKREDNADV